MLCLFLLLYFRFLFGLTILLCNETCPYYFRRATIAECAKEAFTFVGNMLQEKRQKDFVRTFRSKHIARFKYVITHKYTCMYNNITNCMYNCIIIMLLTESTFIIIQW